MSLSAYYAALGYSFFQNGCSNFRVHEPARMAISNFPDFHDAGQESYSATKIWNLCQGLEYCPTEGKIYTVYAKFYAPWGRSSKVVSDSIIYQKGATVLEKLIIETRPKPVKPTEIPSSYRFTSNLRFKQRGVEVRYLQIFLKAQGPEIYPEGIVSGWFGPATQRAVIRFQEKNASDILAPLKLTKGTGLVGKTTRAKINEILGR